MKTHYISLSITMLILMFVTFAKNSEANWNKAEKNNYVTSQEVNSQNSKIEKSESMPAGVTQDLLNSLTDENGNSVISRQPNEDPEIDATQQRTFNGAATGDNYGTSVASAGDVNGDGYEDIIIGAPFNDFKALNAGRAYIFFGGINMNTIVDITLTGDTVINYFGASVSGAGDVNGDGYADVIVGAYGNSSNKGKSYIYYGGAAMNNIADVTMSGEAANDYFGFSVSGAEDVNGDGYSDVIVGAYGNSSYKGRSYIYYGGAVMNNIADVTMNGEFANNYFGFSVSKAGDVNGDGYSDVITGAYGYSSSAGRSYIYLGSAAMDNMTDVVMTGATANNYFAFSVAKAGDVNGDGYSDVITGAYGNNSNTGKAYIYFGGFLMDYTEDVTLTGEGISNFFGNSVSGAEDVNGDGYSDVIIGAKNFGLGKGKAYVYYGGASMNNISDISLTGENAGDNYGYCVTGGGDVNGDGYSDISAGANGFNTSAGRVYVYTNTMSGEDIIDLTATGESAGNNLGSSLSSAGDVNGDGYPDLIVGASGYSSNKGRVYIYYGGNSMDNLADIIMTGQSAGSKFGVSVSGAGDVNGDGYSDVIVGASGFNSNTGKAYIYYGGANMDTVSDVSMNGSAANNNFGVSVAGAGDVNGDGYNDVIIGADGAYTNSGEITLYFGGAVMDNIPDFSSGGTTNYKLGHSVSSAGDINGDGYSDIIAGAYGYNSSTGAAYIFYGGAIFTGNVNVILLGEITNSNFGYSVSSAGDVNGDGYSDVIIGAYQYNNIQGKAYIYYGNVIMDNSADVILNTESSYNYFGYSVSAAGDVNSDGYSDVIVGAPLYNGNGISNGVGKSYIYFGGSQMNNIADISMTGQTITDYNGTSVSAAGDLNGDGYSDVISGATGNNSGTGKVYIYFSSPPSVKPILNYVKDVPNDQGGRVNLKWARSGYDVNGSSLITDYLVQRSFPPTGGNFSWQNISTISASHESFYTYVDFTPSDSSSLGSGTFFYRITARTSDINQYWRSAIISGRSIDNIAPLMLSPFTATSSGNDVRLNWKRSTALDLLNYILYRSTSPVIDPQTEPSFVLTTDSTYLDTAPLNESYYYFAVAQDIHNNKSPVAVVAIPNNKRLIMYGAIQGLYDANSDTEIYDTVKVYLRNSAFPFELIDSSKNLLYGPGTGQEFLFANLQNNIPYYVVVKHRNALETWSADPVTFVSGDASIAFSVSSVFAYGNNEIQVDNSPYDVFAFYSGDVNQDGIIDAGDISAIENDAVNSVFGYVPTDLTGDDAVDASDISLVENNAVLGVYVVTP